jgi:hypothetical protein
MCEYWVECICICSPAWAGGCRPLAHAGSSLADFSTLKMEAIYSSETSVQTRSTRRHILEDGILQTKTACGIWKCKLKILLGNAICSTDSIDNETFLVTMSYLFHKQFYFTVSGLKIIGQGNPDNNLESLCILTMGCGPKSPYRTCHWGYNITSLSWGCLL